MNIRVFGPPGTGKTTFIRQTLGHLLGRVDATSYLLEYGLELPYMGYKRSDIVFMSHTNSAVDELLSRLDMRRTYANGLWGTMHGIALHLILEKTPSLKRVVQNTLRKPGAVSWWKAKFAREEGIPYDPDEELSVLDGNQFFQAYSRAINVYFPKYYSMSRVIDKLALEDDRFAHWASSWMKFKADNKVIDFDDMLMIALLEDVVPDGKVLVADEFQDFSPLQWALFKNWMTDMEYVIVAGDDDQCIFSYTGASPRFMLHEFLADKSIVLKRSYRLPSKILKLSRHFIEHLVPDRYPKVFEPRAIGGKVLMKNIPMVQLPFVAKKIAQTGASVMVLMRTNGQVKSAEEAFIQAKVPYYRIKTKKAQIWADFVDRIVTFIEDLKNGSVTAADARFYLKFTDISPSKISELALLLSTNPKNLVAQAILKDPIRPLRMSKLINFFGSEKMSHIAIDMLRLKLSGNLKDLPGKIYIDTIHAAKGREADVVILYDSITNRIYEEMLIGGREAFETEARVWYVGLTRARSAIILNSGDYPFVTPKLLHIANMLKEKARAK